MRIVENADHHGPLPSTTCSRPLYIIADDLTGACDAAVAFVAVHRPVRVRLTDELPWGKTFCAVSTETRHLSANEAASRIDALAQHLPPEAEVFKKIDSVFRGNTAVEICAALRSLPFDLAILAPAFPALGRHVQHGILHIHNSAGDRSLSLSQLLAEVGCHPYRLAASLSQEALTAEMRPYLQKSSPAVLCDARHDSDLIHIVRAARSLEKRILWIGSAGLAHALASQQPALPPVPETPPRRGCVLFFVGSTHPVTGAQVEHLKQTAQIAEHCPAAIRRSRDLLVPIALGHTTPDDIRHAIATLPHEQITCLFMTGGDTAHFVCRALGIQALRIEREFAPGVPLSVAEGGPFDGIPVVLKSGGFGERDLLCRLLETFGALHEVTA
jgi:D-threonate/D-erythronate kinase